MKKEITKILTDKLINSGALGREVIFEHEIDEITEQIISCINSKLPTDEEIQEQFPEFGHRGGVNYDCYTKRNGAKYIRDYIRDKNLL